jgi:predicted nucleotidyltransferase
MKLDLNKIRKDLKVLKGREVVLFGSRVREEARPHSDIDIAIVSRCPDKEQNLVLLQSLVGVLPTTYDLKIFELLPLKIQKAIADEFVPVFGDPLDLSEYFYLYRKRWADCRYRIFGNTFSSYVDQVQALQANKKEID